MKIIITEKSVSVEGFEFPLDHENCEDWSCRLHAHEAIAWGISRLSEELKKSVAYYRTGKHTDNVILRGQKYEITITSRGLLVGVFNPNVSSFTCKD